MDKNFLVRLFGFPATLIHGEPMVLDRWIWLIRRLPSTDQGLKLLDVGCGNGSFTMGLALRGYETLGLSFDEQNMRKSSVRAGLCKARNVKFEVCDVRHLGEKRDLDARFDVVICLEMIEHILNDTKVILDISGCLKPGGRLLLTTPNLDFIPLGIGDKTDKEIEKTESGGHVRKGYSREDLSRLCASAGLTVDRISYCSGFLSQKLTVWMRLLNRIHPVLGWIAVFPLRPLPVMFDGFLSGLLKWPGYSICLEAHKN